jgi:hypothetical protein
MSKFATIVLGLIIVTGASANYGIDSIKSYVKSNCSNGNSICHTLAILDGMKIIIDTMTGNNNGSNPYKPDAYAQYTCSTFGELTINLTSALTGSDFSKEFDVGQEYDCNRFVSNWKRLKTKIYGHALVAICDNFGYLTRIKVDALNSSIDFISKKDIGSTQECLVQENFVNSII